ncbi:FixH family protein [Priestia endophytica]|uniref:FixH family protein n=1 Tax=Priestia endophytica TaxID=135735 RepID=UPI00227DA904|nr:FixH family protein [Priestia endophytica]MCY8232333.1 FixH family protein [Priestia endophytica]
MRTTLILFISLLLVGYSQSSIAHSPVETPALKVSLNSDTTKLTINNTASLTAFVTYGAEKIDDAYVQFEIIENGASLGMVSPKVLEEGKYVLDTKFLEPGEKQVIVHVDYKEQHEMKGIFLSVTNGEEGEAS